MEVPRHWRIKKQRYQLMGSQCPDCKEVSFPPRDICPRCSNKQPDKKLLTTVVTDVTIRT
jgi:uncharacterized OB-fold protein